MLRADVRALPAVRVCAPLLWIAAGALALRVAALALQGPAQMEWDGANFIRTAQSLLAGHGYIGLRGTVNILHAPLYPLLIAGLLPIVHDGEACGLAVSLLAGALLPLAVYGAAQPIFGRRTGLAAAAIAAVFPALVELSVQVLADQLAVTLEFTALALLFRWMVDGRPARLAGCGATIGLAYLARPEELFLVLVAAVVVALRRRPALRAAAGNVALVVVPCALLAAPYVAFLTDQTGHVRLEAKSTENYAIGMRMRSGMGYVEAADGIGPHLEEIGAELGDGFWVTHRSVTDPTLRERVDFMVHAAPRQLSRLARILVSLHYGSPLFALAALAGVALGLRRGASRWPCGVLVAGFGFHAIALLSLWNMWDRYAAPFAPFLAIWGAGGIVAAVDRLVAGRPVARPVLAGGAAALTVAVLGIFAATVAELRSNAVDPRPLIAAARWIALHEPGPRTIMSVTPLVSFYAGDVWHALPYAPSERAAAYVRLRHPDLVVLEPRDPDRPYLAAWRHRGIPLPEARRIYSSGGPNAVDVYRV